MTERFRKAYDSLVRAYFEGTLAKFTCMACACGNIISDAIGRPITKELLEAEIASANGNIPIDVERELIEVKSHLESLWADKRQGNYDGMCYEAVEAYKNEVNDAGYTTTEFAKIETAFENNTSVKYHYYNMVSEEEILEDQYKGLCAVVDVLLELDNETPQGDELKQEFRKHPKLQTV